MRRVLINIFMMMVWMVSLVSCGKFSYSEDEVKDTKVSICITSEDSVNVYKVMMARLVNTKHYVWEVDSLTHSVDKGEYYVAVFHADNSYDVPGLNAFAAEQSVSMQDVYAAVPIMTPSKDDPMEGFNAYAPFVADASGPLVADFMKVSLTDTSHVLTFSPRPLTQHLTFRLKLRTEEGVIINGVEAAVSGVAGKVRLMSGLLRHDDNYPTYRQRVVMEPVSYVEGLTLYQGSVSVLGLFPPSSSQYQSGPGIFQVKVNASVEEDGVLLTREFQAGINLRNVIIEARLMEEAKDRSGYRITTNQAVVEVPVVLNVLRDYVTSGDGDGLEQWFENDADIEVEI